MSLTLRDIDQIAILALPPLVQDLPAFVTELLKLKASMMDVHRSALRRWMDARKFSMYLNCYAFANDHVRRIEP